MSGGKRPQKGASLIVVITVTLPQSQRTIDLLEQNQSAVRIALINLGARWQTVGPLS